MTILTISAFLALPINDQAVYLRSLTPAQMREVAAHWLPGWWAAIAARRAAARRPHRRQPRAGEPRGRPRPEDRAPARSDRT